MDINDDSKMLAYGRYCAKQKMIREAKEAMRDIVVTITNTNDAESVKNLKEGFIKHSDDLIAALSITFETKGNQ